MLIANDDRTGGDGITFIAGPIARPETKNGSINFDAATDSCTAVVATIDLIQCDYYISFETMSIDKI